MLAVLLLNRMTAKHKAIRQQHKLKTLKEQLAKTRKIEKKRYNAAKKAVSVCCRTCLATDDLVAIFYDKQNEEKRSKELKIVTGLEIKLNDGLSQKMCNKCVETIDSVIQFRKTCRRSQKTQLSMGPVLSRNKKLQSPKMKLKQAKVEKVDMDDYSYEIFGEAFQDDGYDMYPGIVKSEAEAKPKKMTASSLKKRRITLAHHGGYKCNICEKEFKLKSTYNSHMRFHTDYCICEVCGKRCRNYNQLQEHKRAKHGLFKIHKCAYCDYSSATKEALIIHERRHTGERPYVCDHCGATFHRRANLVQHIAIHLPEKNFQCDMCPKRLKSRKFLQIHKHNSHTGKRYGYLCGVCEHRFEKPNKVRAHTRRVHGIPDEHQAPVCEYCSKREKSQKRLNIHKYSRHRERKYRYVCPICGATYGKPWNVRVHISKNHAIEKELLATMVIQRLEVPVSSMPKGIPETGLSTTPFTQTPRSA